MRPGVVARNHGCAGRNGALHRERDLLLVEIHFKYPDGNAIPGVHNVTRILHESIRELRNVRIQTIP
jgi:hypothetical protein